MTDEQWPALKVLQRNDGMFYPPKNPGNDHIALLQSAVPDSIYIQWEVNSTYEAQFTAYDDGSEAFDLLEVQNMVEIGDQWFMIKQIQPDYSGGITTVDVTLSHISNEISRMRWYKPGELPSGDNSDLTVKGDDDSADQIQELSPDDILKQYFDTDKSKGNGITYQIIGQFNKVNIETPMPDSNGKDVIDRILENWPDAVFYPDNLNMRIYSHDEFYKDYGNRIDYLHDTNEITLSYDSTDMVNGARLVGATYEQNTTVDTGLPNGNAGKGAQAVINDAKKYVGVPYVYGGAGGSRGGNPFSGMDCSSFVSQVYKDFGINVPAYTVSLESCGHVVGSPQTGDMGFYGSHGASYHVTLALNSTTMEYEPQPGESCKITPISYYPPSWWERNDQMAAVVGSTGGDDDVDNTTTDSKEMYYFAPFWYEDKESVQRWGTFAGDDITSDTAQSKEDMIKVAEAQFKPNPDLEIDATLDSNRKPIPGELVRVEVRPKNYVTKVAVVGFQWYLYSKNNQTTETLNSNAKNILDYDNAQKNELQDVRKSLKTIITNPSYNNSGQETWTESEAKAFDNSERS